MMLKKKRNLFISVAILIALTLIPSVAYGYNSYSYKKHYNLGLENLKQDKYEEATAEFNKALEYKKSKANEINTQTTLIEILKQSKIDYEQGLALLGEKKYTEAITIFKKVVKEDEKRYSEAQGKISESKSLFTSENINKAKEEASNKRYQEAIKFLENVIAFDSSNSEASELKNQYTAEMEKEKAELAKKEIEEKAKKEAEKKAEEKVKKEEQKKPSTTTDKPSSPPSEEDIVAVNNGFFAIKDAEGNLKAVFGWVPGAGYMQSPEGVSFSVRGNDLDYEVAFHFIGGRIATHKGKTSKDFVLIPATYSEVSYRQEIKITITVVYKGKKYTDTFTQVLNNLYDYD